MANQDDAVIARNLAAAYERIGNKEKGLSWAAQVERLQAGRKK
jgi:hypothetical protein